MSGAAPDPSSSSSTKLSPLPTPSIAELRILLLDCSEQLIAFEAKLAKGRSPTRRTISSLASTRSPEAHAAELQTLSARLALISNLLQSQTDGVALFTAEQQLLGLLLRSLMDRVRERLKAPTAPSAPAPSAGIELPLDSPDGSKSA